MAASAKVQARVASQLKKYCGILNGLKQRDVNETDTCSTIRDMLSDVLGYDRNLDVTSEFNIRNSYVDLAVQYEASLRFLIEVKAIGITLKDRHVKQAIDYAANKGVEWVVLTNGAVWRIYKVIFSQPIEKMLACEIDILSLGPKNPEVREVFGNLSREAFSKDTMSEFLQRKEMSGKFVLATLLMSDAMIDELRKEIRRLSGVRLDPDELQQTLANEVIKRELIEGDEGKQAQAIVKKYLKSQTKTKRQRNTTKDVESAAISSNQNVLDVQSSAQPGE